MKKHNILLVDGYNMIAFWQETRQLFKTNRLDEARELLLRKLNHYAHFEHLDIVVVSAMTSTKFQSSLPKKMRLRILISNERQQSSISQHSISFLWQPAI